MSLPRYFKYKASGVQWPIELPEHWSIRKVKKLASRVSSGKTPAGGSETYVDEGVVFIRSQNVYDEGLRLDDVAYISDVIDEEMAVSRVMPNDILLNITGASIGRSCIVPDGFPRANVNQHVCAIRVLQDVSVNFIAWYFKSVPIKTQIDFFQNGAGREGLNFDQIGRMVVAIPTFPEMVSIVSFLNREVGKIDALIFEQEKLIALLAEKRQATISHAVTKGLNPNAPMKDSGVKWMGVVPEHWLVGALSYLSSIETGATPDRSAQKYWTGPIPWIKTGEIAWKPIAESEEFISELALNDTAAKIAKPGTLMMAMYGQGVTRGRVAILRISASFNQACAAITFGPRMFNEFGRYFFMSAYDHIRDDGNETSQMNLSAGVIAKIKLPVPPVEEQTEIVSYLDVVIARLDALSAEASRGILLLKERRSALISAAVTGKIDVRQAVRQEQITFQEAA